MQDNLAILDRQLNLRCAGKVGDIRAFGTLELFGDSRRSLWSLWKLDKGLAGPCERPKRRLSRDTCNLAFLVLDELCGHAIREVLRLDFILIGDFNLIVRLILDRQNKLAIVVLDFAITNRSLHVDCVLTQDVWEFLGLSWLFSRLFRWLLGWFFSRLCCDGQRRSAFLLELNFGALEG